VSFPTGIDVKSAVSCLVTSNTKIARSSMFPISNLSLDLANDAVNGELLCGDEQAFKRFKAEIEAEFDEQRETLRRQQRLSPPRAPRRRGSAVRAIM